MNNMQNNANKTAGMLGNMLNTVENATNDVGNVVSETANDVGNRANQLQQQGEEVYNQQKINLENARQNIEGRANDTLEKIKAENDKHVGNTVLEKTTKTATEMGNDLQEGVKDGYNRVNQEGKIAHKAAKDAYDGTVNGQGSNDMVGGYHLYKAMGLRKKASIKEIKKKFRKIKKAYKTLSNKKKRLKYHMKYKKSKKKKSRKRKTKKRRKSKSRKKRKKTKKRRRRR